VFINREEENALMHIHNVHKKYRHAFFPEMEFGNSSDVNAFFFFFFFSSFFSLSEKIMTEKQQKIN